mgnify:CR=1 FL=1
MIGDENFWTNIIDQPLDNSAENVEAIMQGQCADVKSASCDLIDARFIKLSFTTKKTTNMWTTQEIKQQFTGPKTVKVEETALDLTDANDSYSPSDYAFDLFTTEYKFRVLTMRLGAVYPIDLILDDDIFYQTKDLYAEEIQISERDSRIFVQNDDELRDCLKIIISMNEKMKFVVRKMIESERALRADGLS